MLSGTRTELQASGQMNFRQPPEKVGFSGTCRRNERRATSLLKLAVSREPRNVHCVCQVSESATTSQAFREIEYAAGMPQNVLSAAKGASRAIGPRRRCNGFLLNVPAPRIFHRWHGCRGTDRLIFDTLSHEQIGRTRAYVITKWRQSEIQQITETKVPPPRTHGKVGDPVGDQCSAVR
jgi:hypothetical protein